MFIVLHILFSWSFALFLVVLLAALVVGVVEPALLDDGRHALLVLATVLLNLICSLDSVSDICRSSLFSSRIKNTHVEIEFLKIDKIVTKSLFP